MAADAPDSLTEAALKAAVAIVPPGAWAVGVSGGADSVALLFLLAARHELELHAVHLDHQTRGQESTGDARFVAELCARLQIQYTVSQRSDIEAQAKQLPA